MKLKTAVLATSSLAALVAMFLTSQVVRSQPAEAKTKTRVFEIRTYTTEPGKLDALHARFRDHTTRLFEKHGMTNVGYWTPVDEPRRSDTLIYVLAHESPEAAKTSWDGFRNDPEWQKARGESEAAGPIVRKVESVFVTPTDYSPLQ
ncbi:MAG: NIPSNAP family protein [Pirellulales bacterium]